MALLITSGFVRRGVPNPPHTPAGLADFAKIEFPYKPTFVVMGSGLRLLQICREIAWEREQLKGFEYRVSPFCGGAEVIDDEGNTWLASGAKVPTGHYHGTASVDAFDAWAFIRGYPEQALFIGDQEFALALGIPNPGKACLYQIDQRARSYELLQQVEELPAD